MPVPAVNSPLTSTSVVTDSESEQPSMRDRVPAQAAIEQVLRSGVRRRTALDRAFGRNPLEPEARPTFRGAAGERAVAAALAQLPADWTVLHSLPTGRDGADIDHIAVGPAGVVVVTARTPGVRRTALARTVAEARRVERLLDGVAPETAAVVPVVAVVGADRPARSEPRRESGAEPRVVAVEELRDLLVGLPARLGPQDVAAAAARLAAPGSWQAAATAGPDLLVRFGALQRDVAAAERVRTAWTGAAAAAAGTLALAGALGLLPR